MVERNLYNHGIQATLVLGVVFLLVFFQSSAPVTKNIGKAGDIRRPEATYKDGTDFDSLTSFLIEHQKLFAIHSELNALNFAEEFIKVLTPWILAAPRGEITSHPFKFATNCNDEKYGQFLSGRQLQFPRMIVDFVPFGYDLDKLEIRLLENYHSVTAFVIFESELTQTGTSRIDVVDRICLTLP
jgi:hypothetical protein